MKKIVFFYLAAIVLVSAGCTKNEYKIYEDAIASKVYFVQAVESTVVEVGKADLDDNGCISLYMYNAGNNEDEITVEVVPDQNALDIYNVENEVSVEMLPENYWSMGKSTFVFDTDTHYQDSVRVSIDFSALDAAVSDISGYILPLSIQASDMRNVNYDYKTLFIKLKKE